MTDASVAEMVLSRAVSRQERVRLWAFYAVLTAALLLLAVPMGPFLVIPFGWPFLAEELGVHRLHDVAVASVLWLVLIGLLAQVRRNEPQVGAMQQLLLVILILLGLTAIARPATLLGPLLVPFGLAFVGAALHPARKQIVRVGWKMDPVLAALAMIAAGPLLVYARGQLDLDHSALPLAAHGGHWTAMASLAVSIVVLAFLAATRPRGWRVPVWSVGGAALLLGTASAALPHMPSSIGPVRGMLTAVWAIVFVVTAQVRYRNSPGEPA